MPVAASVFAVPQAGVQAVVPALVVLQQAEEPVAVLIQSLPPVLE